jgi:hypothetical protein
MKRGWWIGKFLVFGLAMLVLIGVVTMSLWNWLVPVLFSGPVITFWQALGLLALSKILFWTFGGKSHSQHRGSWKYYWKSKWDNMTPGDRERLKQKMKEKWCRWDDSTSIKDSEGSNG